MNAVFFALKSLKTGWNYHTGQRPSPLVWRSPSGARFSCVRTENSLLLSSKMNSSNENDEVYRAISNGKLHMLPCFHTRPINVVVFHGSQGTLVFRLVSRLDAFSGYPFRM